MRYVTSVLRPAALLLMIVTAGTPIGAQIRAGQAKPQVTVYKTPTCGCCGKWVEHMQASGFTATTTSMPDLTAIKTQHQVPAALQSCHTSLVGGYVIEGHVPAEDIRRLLREKPAIVGLAAPGMPAGSPGMDVPNAPGYDVIAFDKDGHTRVFASHKGR
jgi:hypothetical protein